MARSLKKGPFVAPHLLEKIDRMNTSGVKKPVKTWARRSMVTPDFVGHTFLVHNGKTFISVFVTENMVGHKLGEFSPTRIFKKHGAHTAKVTKLLRKIFAVLGCVTLAGRLAAEGNSSLSESKKEADTNVTASALLSQNEELRR